MSAVDLLACPACGGDLTPDADPPRVLRCATGHSFDVARQGYVNLLGHAAPANADTPDMVAARERFLGAGWYAPIADAVCSAVPADARAIVEVGAGTGYYLASVLDRLPDAVGLATDVSVAASKRAARAHPRARAIVADTWAGLPVRDASVDAVLCVFAPRNPAEFRRVLRPGGTVVVVTPTEAHLAELRDRLGLLGIEPDKADHLASSLADGFSPGPAQQVTFPLDLPADAVADLVAMGPNAFHAAHRLADAAPQAVTASVQVTTYVRRGHLRRLGR